MINNLNDQNLPSSTNSALASFGGFPAPEKSRLGTIVKLCSNVDSKEKNLALEKAREYRKRNIKLKDRAGEILYIPNQKKQAPVCSCGKCRIDGSAPVGVDYTKKQEWLVIQICNIAVLFGCALTVVIKLARNEKRISRSDERLC